MKRLVLGFTVLLGFCGAVHAQSTPPLATVVTTCGTPPSTYVAGTNRPIIQDVNGNQCTGATVTPSGTQNVNVTQIGGNAVSTGTGASGTGTQRVVTSTDSTIGVEGQDGSTQTSLANPFPVIPGTGTTFTIVQPTAANLNAQVQGPAALSASATGNPERNGCIFHSSAPTLSDGQIYDTPCDSSGHLVQLPLSTTGAGADGVSNTAAKINCATAAGNEGVCYQNIQNYIFNGSTWDRSFTCNQQATISVTAGSTTQIVGLSGSTVIRVCNFTVSMSLAGTVSVLTGTGTNCGTPTTVIPAMALATGTPISIMGPSGGSAFRSTVGGEICVAAATGNAIGYLTYAQF